ncbi:hypothetical protein BH10CYA1_BH10CYA1_32300 [soil metagenome]
MHCTNCQSNKNQQLRKSAVKQSQERCEHCGFSINDKCQRLNSFGFPTDSKGEPKAVTPKYIPPPRRWIKA